MTRSSRLAGVSLTILALLIVSVPTLSQTTTAKAALSKFGIGRTEAGFVELGFTNPNSVKEYVGAFGDTQLDFRITSRLPQHVQVRWRVTQDRGTDGRSRVLQSGRVDLAPAQSRQIAVITTVRCTTTRSRVAVAISVKTPSGIKRDEIHFWVVQDGEDTSGRPLCRIP